MGRRPSVNILVYMNTLILRMLDTSMCEYSKEINYECIQISKNNLANSDTLYLL